MFLDPAKWKKSDEQPIQEIPVPEWGGHLLHRALSGEELIQVQTKASEETGTHDRVAGSCELIARALVGEDGKRLYTPTLGFAIKDWPAPIFGRVFDAISTANGLKDVAAKNSNAGGSGSSSGSPSEPVAKP